MSEFTPDLTSNYTPTTDVVRQRYIEHAEPYDALDRLVCHAEFDAWIAQTVAAAKAEAWAEGFADGARQDAEGDDGPRFINPYSQEARR